MVKLTFMGGTRKVGGNAVTVQSKEANLLLEYGVKPGTPPEFPGHVRAKDIDGIIPKFSNKYLRFRIFESKCIVHDKFLEHLDGMFRAVAVANAKNQVDPPCVRSTDIGDHVPPDFAVRHSDDLIIKCTNCRRNDRHLVNGS